MGLLSEPRVFTVTQISSYIKNLLEQDLILNSLLIKGEISNLKKHSAGHLFFTLKDAGAAISCVMFESAAQEMPFSLENGMSVVICGYISLYERTGQYQLYAEFAEPLGIGALQLAFEQTKERLAAEGLFDAELKREIPKQPSCIAVVTSPTGAVIRDIIHVAKRRDPSVKIVLFPAAVQGTAAPTQIVEAIKDANRWGKADVLIVGRGGGSMEDLWAFNEEKVARAIFASEIPVISAVGHETDFTIADFVADLRAPTPSAAAELATVDQMAQKQHLLQMTQRLKRAFAVQMEEKRRCFLQLSLPDWNDVLQNRRKTLADQQERLQKNMTDQLLRHAQQLHHFCARLEAVSPLALLSRGYTVVTDAAGKTVTSVLQMQVGDRFYLHMQDGVLEGTVTKRSVTKYGEEKANI